MSAKSKKIDFIVNYFSETQPDVKSELNYSNPFELLVATILAAQCTDKRVNMVTPSLFSAYPTVFEMSKADESEILTFIKSISYPNSKAKHLSEMSRKVVSDFAGNVPDTMENLLTLPGVGRKTANVVLAFGFGKAAMPVDTHVFRVSHRLGLVNSSANTPELVEKELVKSFPEYCLSNAHHWLLLHGRYVCTAKKPHCGECGLSDICDSKLKV